MQDGKNRPAETPDVSHIHTPGVAHEESDVKVGGVALFTAGLAALMVLTGVLMWGMFNFFSTTEHRKEPPPTSRSREKKPEGGNPEDMFPEPRLQRLPVRDLQEFRAQEEEKLTTYGWVDPNAGIVRIPIEEAKKRIEKQGLPYQQSLQMGNPAAGREEKSAPEKTGGTASRH